HDSPIAAEPVLGGRSFDHPSRVHAARVNLPVQQDADGVDLAGLRDLTKSAAASSGLESMIAAEHVLGGRSFDHHSRVHAARVNLHLFGVVEGEDDMIRMGMVRDVTLRFVREYLAVLLDVIRRANTDESGEPVADDARILTLGPAAFAKYPRRWFKAIFELLRERGFWRLGGWIVREGAKDLARLPLRLVPGWALTRYATLPGALRGHIRFAERKLRLVKWQYLLLSIVYQLELTRAQIPLQRLGLKIEQLVSMLAVCHHAAVQDPSQQDIADLQARLLREKYAALRFSGSLRHGAGLRHATARVGQRIEDDSLSLFADLAAEPYAHPWDDEARAERDK
ncbi:MAG: acyl-CoA dehydrogenase, partial [Gammaproteobacteria bacterium]|nr:acyl-CoA dehydrogenase [Gammaproteobacteria bacterium]